MTHGTMHVNMKWWKFHGSIESLTIGWM